ncbi:MAG: pyruvate:ferredoxin (flavodoxin) oxidoreductase [Chlamydiae bacterium]|nr:pyruvate:ferredoxin (flavodoxin) oxidoreductase [Chlamydiota bacterium]
MGSKKMKSMDGNTAAALIAYGFSEVCAIFPITPSSVMAELADEWSSKGKKNLFDKEVEIVEMQSEAGAAGVVHGVLSSGAFSSTFTASQGLLLMIPNMYKIAGELLPSVFHISSRALAGQALSIFGDHQDVMAARATGFAMLCSNSVQEVMDLALVAHLATLRSSVPFMHFFDGFRTSHEIQKVEEIAYEDILPLIDMQKVDQHRKRGLNPEHPYQKGTAQNPDVYFQAMESSNKFYDMVPKIVEEEMEKVYKITNRKYKLFDYFGHKDAERIIIIMGSGASAVEETVEYLISKGEKVGVVKVRLYRPFSIEHFLSVVPKSAKKIAVLDRTKESGAFAEPLFLDVAACFQDRHDDRIIVGGRYGLGSKDFTPSMIKAVFDNLKLPKPKNHFTVGIVDDVTHLSLDIDETIHVEDKDTIRCKFWGVGGDGTVGSNKDAIKIIGDNTEKFVQGYFAYDSKKTSGVTISYLRFGIKPIKSSYLIEEADYIACHQPSYVQKYNVLQGIKKGGIFVLNSPWSLEEMQIHLPAEMRREIASKKIKFYNINASLLAEKLNLGVFINMIMQPVFFKLTNILPFDKALVLLKEAIKKTYAKKGDDVVLKNQSALDEAIKGLTEVKYPSSWEEAPLEEKEIDLSRPEFIRKVVDTMNAQEGDVLPVSSFTPGGILPLGTAQYERREIATHVSHWIPENCIQCNQCSFVCPHAAIRPFLVTEEEAKKAPKGYQGIKAIGKDVQNMQFNIAITPFDCTGCENCVRVCPAKEKALEMKPIEEVIEKEGNLWDYFIKLPLRGSMNKFTLKGSQFKKPLLEFSGACAGCGETPYAKVLTQLFGERMIIANATGCTSIWGASYPAVPYTVTARGYGPAWANSLFEDNAEFGFGIYLANNYRREKLARFVKQAMQEKISDELKALFEEWLKNFKNGEKSMEISEKIKPLLKTALQTDSIKQIIEMSDILTKPSIWIVGGDGWAYDIGYGGLDHVLAMGRDTNVLVLDTELYSNTGGQASKATPLGSVAKYAAGGKRRPKKDLGLIAMTYGNIYVASISMGADKAHVVRVLQEAESYDGPSLIIAFASCISHGLKCGMSRSVEEEKEAVESGYWFNYRYDPRLKAEGKNPFHLDSKDPTKDLEGFLSTQMRFEYLKRTNPEVAKELFDELKLQLHDKLEYYKKLSS